MVSPTLVQTSLAIVFAALGIVGFVVSLHPPSTGRTRRAYLAVFVMLSLLGVVLVFWQAKLTEQSQNIADSTANELRRQVSSLYESQMVAHRRSTRAEVDALSDRVEVMRATGSARFGNKPSVKHRAQLLSAEILLFVAERSQKAPYVESIKSAGADDGKVTPSETLEKGRKLEIFKYIEIDGGVEVSTDEEAWLEKNKALLEYHSHTETLFRAKFTRPYIAITKDLEEENLIDQGWLMRSGWFHGTEYGMRKAALRLTEAVEKLPR
jgi:hypothetical protein